jgi:predicted metal-binding membrane protein
MTSAARNEVTGAGALQALARPRAIAIACIGVLVAAGWVYLALMLAGGDGLLAAICAPTFGASAATTALQAVLVFAMWGAMALAMMLPTAGPMILTYADLAETAARRGEAAASPLVLTAGYVAVAVVAAALQILLARLSLIDPAMAAASPLFSGAAFIAAGAYQFSALKHACITQCQRPFTYFFANWTADARGVFRQGVTQGLYCLGCCWAMMALMLVVGTMNVLWMAGLGAIMTIEKVGTTTRFSRIIGAVFIVAGAVLIVTAVIAKWPRVG